MSDKNLCTCSNMPATSVGNGTILYPCDPHCPVHGVTAPEPEKYQLDKTDAMLVAMVVGDAFASLPWEDLTMDQRTGVVLFMDALMARVGPLLDQTDPNLAHVFTVINSLRVVSNMTRQKMNLPHRD